MAVWGGTREPPVYRAVNPFDNEVRARLTTKLIDLRRQGYDRPLITTAFIDEASVSSPMPLAERAVRLLALMSSLAETLVDPVSLLLREVGAGALAFSESVSETGLLKLCEYLAEKRWIEQSVGPGMPPGWVWTVTAAGHIRAEELAAAGRSTRIGFKTQ